MTPVRVKICGVTRVDDARCAADAGAWAIGLNFYPASPRCVVVEQAVEIVAAVPDVLSVGVFVNEDPGRAREIADRVGFGALQFHGDEDPAYCRGWTLPVIKAIRVRDSAAAQAALRYDVAYVLADAYVPGAYGGSGERVPEELLRAFPAERLILAGGLDPENVAGAVQSVRPFAVDVASGVESSPGHKDPEKIRRFVENAIHA